ncbi:MAG: tetratricopeptide repeat protein, partial [Verrucomicrobiota bacterium]
MLTIKKRTEILLVFSVLIGLASSWEGCAPAGTRALAKGEKLLKAGKYPEAVMKFEEATTAFPNHAKAWNQLGLGYQYAGYPRKAAQAYQKALTLDRNLTAASYNLGMLFFEQRNFPDAIARLTTFIQLEPKNPDGWLELGLAQMQYANTVPAAEKARQLEAAKKNLEWAQKIRPSAQTLNAIGMVQIQRGRPREAVPSFAAALKLDPNYAPAYLNLAVANQQPPNDNKQALVNYRQFLSIAKSAPERASVQAAVAQLENDLNPPQSIPTFAQTNVTKPAPTFRATNVTVAPKIPTNP